MRARLFALALCLAACRPDPVPRASAPDEAAAPSPAEPSPAGPSPQPNAPSEDTSMDELIGTWSYAKDPEGVVEPNSFYEGGSVTFTEAGGYTMAMGDGGYKLEGRYEVTSASPERVVLATSYSDGRSNTLTLQLRRDAGGAIVGFAVLETEEELPTRYYAKPSN